MKMVSRLLPTIRVIVQLLQLLLSLSLSISLVMLPAKSQVVRNRLQCQEIDWPQVRRHSCGNIKLWPFKITVGSGDKPMIEVNFMGEENFHPEEISSMVLNKMKVKAESYLRTRTNDAVITVPTYILLHNEEPCSCTSSIHIISDPSTSSTYAAIPCRPLQKQVQIVGGGVTGMTTHGSWLPLHRYIH